MFAPPTGRPAKPPRRPERGWLAVVLVILAASLMAGLVVWTNQPPAVPPSMRADTYVPADGHRELLSANAQSAASFEWAHLWAVRAFLAGPLQFRLMLEDQAPSGDYIRLTTAFYPMPTVPVYGETLFERTTRGLQRDVEIRGKTAYAYDEPELALPADVADGSTWTSKGRVRIDSGGSLTTGRYTTASNATAGESGCLNVTHKQQIEGSTPSVFTETWCEGRGIVAQQRGGADMVHIDQWPAEANPQKAVSTASATQPSSIRGWKLSQFDAPPDGAFPDALNAPVMASKGLFQYATATTDDLASAVIKDDGTVSVAWRGHPGGTVLWCQGFGEVTVVATSARRLAGYTATGLRLWEKDLSEVSNMSAVRVDETTAAVGLSDGTLMAFDIATGKERWSTHLTSQIWTPIAVAKGIVYAADSNGSEIAVDAKTGEKRWDSNGDYQRLAVICGGLIVTLAEDHTDLVARKPDTGEVVWSTEVANAYSAAQCVNNTIMLTLEVGMSAISSSGKGLWDTPMQIDADPVVFGDALLVVSGSKLRAIDPAGDDAASWTVEGLGRYKVWLSAGPDSFMLLDRGGALAIGTAS